MSTPRSAPPPCVAEPHLLEVNGVELADTTGTWGLDAPAQLCAALMNDARSLEESVRAIASLALTR